MALECAAYVALLVYDKEFIFIILILRAFLMCRAKIVENAKFTIFVDLTQMHALVCVDNVVSNE